MALSIYADSMSMKSDFQRILDSYLKESEEVKPTNTRGVDCQELLSLYPSLLSDIQTKYFAQGAYKAEKISSAQERESQYVRMKQEWVRDCASESLQSAIECFYIYGARGFLTRKIQDIKRDYRRLALEYHPDRAHFQDKYTNQECHDIFQKIMISYQKLISSS